jgi:hypothetical protein
VHLMPDRQDVPLTTTRLVLEPLVAAHAQSLYTYQRNGLSTPAVRHGDESPHAPSATHVPTA